MTLRTAAGPAAVVAVSLVLAACAQAGEDAAPPSPRPAPASPSPTAAPPEDRFDPHAVALELRPVYGGLAFPLFVTGAGDGSSRRFVVEQGGRILVDAGEGLRPFLDLRGLVRAGGEQGLLGLAFHPDFADNGRLFVNYTDVQGATVVAEYRARPGADAADPGSARVLLRVGQPFANHNGGMLAFGPDGYLYVALGDGGSGGDPHGNGQRLDTLLGSLLRLDVDAGGRYRAPPDNPFVGREAARPEIWAYGLRNPWRFSFDRDTGDVWIGDAGQNQREEIDRAPAGRGGLNFGWNIVEGDLCFHPPEGCDRSGLEPPVAVYPTGRGCVVVGGYVYRGAEFPELRGGYLFADYCAGTIFALDAGGPFPQEPVVLLETGRTISSFGEDDQGELYVTDHVGAEVLQLTARPR